MSDTLFFDAVSVDPDTDCVASFNSDAHVILGRGNFSDQKSQALRVCGYNAGYLVWITKGLFVGVRKDFLNGRPSVMVREFPSMKSKILSLEIKKPGVDSSIAFATTYGDLAISNLNLAKSINLSCMYFFVAKEDGIEFENFSLNEDDSNCIVERYDTIDGATSAVSAAILSND